MLTFFDLIANLLAWSSRGIVKISVLECVPALIAFG